MNDQDRAEAFLVRLKALPKRPKVTQTDVDQTKRDAALQDYQNRLQHKQRGAREFSRKIVGHRDLGEPIGNYMTGLEQKRRQRRMEQAFDSLERRNERLRGRIEQTPYVE